MGLVTVLSSLIVSICTSTVILLLTHSVFGSLDYPCFIKIITQINIVQYCKNAN